MGKFKVHDKAARALARRSRVRRQSQDLKGEDIALDEDFLLMEQNSLKEVQMEAFVARFDSFSDDEGEERLEKAAKLWSYQWHEERLPEGY